MKRVTFTLLLVVLAVFAFAQKDDALFGPTATVQQGSRTGWLICANGDFDFPGGDMAKSFGLSYRIGPSVLYKTKSNWLFGAKGDFISGGDVHQDSLMINIRDKYGEFLNNVGERIGVPTYERGYTIELEGGRIFNTDKTHPDNGIGLITAVGFIQHKIDIFDDGQSVPQLRGSYLKGYDRLTNGLCVEEYVCYNYFAKKGLIHFNLGLDCLVGFTKDRRDYLFDVMRTDNAQKYDMLFGIRGGWYIPIFKRKSEEIQFQ